VTIEGKVRKFFKKQITFLLFGFVFWLPVAVLIFIIAFLFNNLEEIGRKILLVFLPERIFQESY
jgi:uncharacterized membrane protein